MNVYVNSYLKKFELYCIVTFPHLRPQSIRYFEFLVGERQLRAALGKCRADWSDNSKNRQALLLPNPSVTLGLG